MVLYLRLTEVRFGEFKVKVMMGQTSKDGVEVNGVRNQVGLYTKMSSKKTMTDLRRKRQKILFMVHLFTLKGITRSS